MTSLLGSLWLDLRYALRMMTRTPGLTAVLLVTLAIGIGATTTIFSVVESLVLRPLPYDRPEQLVQIYTELAGKTVYHDFALAPAEYVALARDCRSCAQVAAWSRAEVALAGGDHPVAVLAARATASLRSQQVEPGFAPDHLLTFGIALPRTTYPGTTGDELWRRLEDRMRGLTGVRHAALFDTLPLISGSQIWGFEIPDRPRAPGEPLRLADQGRVVGDDAFDTLGARIVRGRGFTTADAAGAPDVAVINQAFAARYFPGEDPIGRRIVVSAGNRALPRTIVGVFADIRQDIDRPAGTELMIPVWQFAALYEPPRSYSSLVVVIRTAGDPAAALPAVQRAVAALDPTLPLIEPMTMEDGIWLASARARILAQFLSVFAGLALALAAVGIYGVMAYSVAQRTAEIGLRVALGARPAVVRAMVLRQTAALVAAGLALGLGAAIAIDRALGAGAQALFYGERLAQPGMLAAVALAITASALIASWIPVRRATRIEPTVALRNE